jgi:hypothetical protein
MSLGVERGSFESFDTTGVQVYILWLSLLLQYWQKKKKEPHQYLTVKIPLRPTRGSSVLCNKRGATKASKPKAVLLACMSTPHVRRVGPAGNGSSLSLSLSPLHCMFPDRQKQNVVAVPARI